MKSIVKILSLLFFTATMSFGQVIDVSDFYSSNKYFFPAFEHLGENAGLPHYRISALIEDHEGFLWIGTKDGGLMKYNGFDFHSFEFDPSNPFSIASNAVSFVYEDSRNIIWVGTDNALSYLHPLNGNFVRLNIESSRWANSPGDFSSITEDGNGYLLVCTNSGIFCISGIDPNELIEYVEPLLEPVKAGIEVIHFNYSQSKELKPNRVARDIHLDKNDDLWIVSESDLCRFEYSKAINDLSLLSDTTKVDGLYQHIARVQKGSEILCDEEGILWISALDKLVKIDPCKDPVDIHEFPIKENTSAISTLPFDPKRKFWIGRDNSDLMLFNEASKKFYPLTFKTNDINGIYDHGVSCFLRTQSGIIFIGTAWGGLFKYNPGSVSSNMHPHLQDIHLNQTNNLRYVLEDTDGYLWLVVKNLIQCERNSGQINRELNSIAFNKVWYYINKIQQDKNGRFWVGMEGQGLFYMDLPKEKNAKIQYNNVLKEHTITAMAFDHEDQIWVGAISPSSAGGAITTSLFSFDLEGNKVEEIQLKKWNQRADLLEDQFLNHIYADDSGKVWIAAGYGLLSFNKATKEVKYHSDKNEFSKGQLRILSLCPDPYEPDNYIWLATNGGGLICYNIKDNSFKSTLTTDGLSGNHIGSILSDDLGNLWLGTDHGISCLSIDEKGGQVKGIINYDQSDGFITDDFTNYYGHNAVKTKAGELIFTGPRGFQIIDPWNIQQNLHVPSVYISEFQVNYKTANYGQEDSPLDEPIRLFPVVRLPHNKNTLGFEMVAPEFRSPEKIRYSFMLTNYDEDWIDNGSNRKIQFTQLPPGSYELKIRVSMQEGEWTESLEGLKIQILKPWWLSFWAYVIYFLILVLIVWAVHTSQMVQQKMKLDVELNRLEVAKFKELDTLKARFFANISHEFRTPLTLIIGPVQNLLNKVKDRSTRDSLLMIQRNAIQLEQYINEILDLSKLEAKKLSLNCENLDIVKYTRYMLSSFKSQAAESNIKLNLETTNEEIMCCLDQDKLHSIISNLISNAIKYNKQDGNVDVSLSVCKGEEHHKCTKSDGCVIISIKDTGIGIPEDKQPYIFDRYYRVDNNSNKEVLGTGLGLSLVKELVLLHHGDINVKSEVGHFTEFIIQFPLGRKHLKAEEMDIENLEEFNEPDSKGLNNASAIEKNVIDRNKKTILVIEDSADIRTLIRLTLQNIYNVIEAVDGEEGEQKAFEINPDLIVCDRSMPKKVGLEVAKSLKSNEATKQIPFIILSARATRADKIAGLEIGVDAYLTKPFQPKELIVQIEEMLEKIVNG